MAWKRERGKTDRDTVHAKTAYDRRWYFSIYTSSLSTNPSTRQTQSNAFPPPLRSNLPTRHRIRPIPGPRKLGRPIRIPPKALRPYRPRRPPIRGIQHPMIHNPILLAIRTRRETRMAHAIRLLARVLIEDAPLRVLAPVLHVHRVVAHELQLAEAVVAVVGARSGVDDEVLARLRVRELLGPFVGGEARVGRAAVGGFFPGLVGHGEDLAGCEVGGDGPGVGHWGWWVSVQCSTGSRSGRRVRGDFTDFS